MRLGVVILYAQCLIKFDQLAVALCVIDDVWLHLLHGVVCCVHEMHG